MEPGKANTSRPCSKAMRAVIKDPLRKAASTTNIPKDKPLMIRFRLGKLAACGGERVGNSETMEPPWLTMASANARCRFG